MKRIYGNVMTINGVLKEMNRDSKLIVANGNKLPEKDLLPLQKPYLDLIAPTYKTLSDDIVNFEKAFGDWESFIMNGKPTPVDVTDFKKIQRDFASTLGVTRPQPFHSLYYDEKKVLHLRGLPAVNSNTFALTFFSRLRNHKFYHICICPHSLVPNGGPTPLSAVDVTIGDIEADILQMYVLADKMDRASSSLKMDAKQCRDAVAARDAWKARQELLHINKRDLVSTFTSKTYADCAAMEQKVAVTEKPTLDLMHPLYVDWRTNWYKLFKLWDTANKAKVPDEDATQNKIAQALRRLKTTSHSTIYLAAYITAADRSTEKVLSAGPSGSVYEFEF
jgi:hypothetical protein